jgi:hypothetical protein
MEATLYWEWLSGSCSSSASQTHAAHAFHVKLIWQAGEDGSDRRAQIGGAAFA